MSTAKPGRPLQNKPVPDDLAGTPVCKEEDHPTIRVRGSRGVKVRKGGRKRVRGTAAAPSPQGPPTADDLAGIPVSAEGKESLTIRPRKRQQRQ